MKKIVLIICCWVIVLLLVASCKSSKEAISVSLSSLTNAERIHNIIQAAIPYDDLSANLKLTIQTDKTNKDTSVDAQLRIIKNEAIQLSLRAPIIGSEVFRVVVTPENVLIIDRINRQYLYETTQNIKAQTAFDFNLYNLEALLTNQLFIAGKKEINPANYGDFQIREDQFCAYITYLDNQNMCYNFESDYTHRIRMIRIEQKNSDSYLQSNYTNWGLTSNNRIFPMTLNMQLNTSSGVFDLNWLYKSVTVNAGFSVDYNVPNNYRQVTLQQLFRLIENVL